VDVRHARIQRFESEQFRGTFFLFVSLSLLESLDEREPRLDLEVGEHLSSSSSSLSLSLSRLNASSFGDRLIYRSIIVLDYDSLLTFLLLRMSSLSIILLLINRRQTRVSRSSLGETAS